jgi:hypothetical protein
MENQMNIAIYNTGSYADYDEADKSGALYKRELTLNCYTPNELAHYIKEAVNLVQCAVEMMDGSKPFNCAFEHDELVIDNLKNKTIEQITTELIQMY